MSKYNYKKIQGPNELSTRSGVGHKKVDFQSHEVSVPCQTGCPAGTNIPGYIEHIAKGQYDEAYKINLEDNMMPGVLGRICVRPCQEKCRHNWTDINGSVEICSLKRSAADRVESIIKPFKPYFESSGKTVAIIGGGPSGLAAARELSRYGHSVTIFEKEDHLGGMLIDGIPRYRLPEDVVQEEIQQIIDYGIDVEIGVLVDDSKYQAIKNQFDCVVIATGTTVSNKLDIKGMDTKDVKTGLEFMKAYNGGEITSLKGDVVIIGGGFTAVDSARSCARTARKLMGKNGKVTIVYRRSMEYMAADQRELNEMGQEHITIKTLLSPIEIKRLNGKLKSVVFQKSYMKTIENQEKPDMIPINGSKIDVACSHVILAIGQKQDYSLFDDDFQRLSDYRTSESNVFAIGDFFSGSKDVIHSIGDGKNVSHIIDTYLMGQQRLRKSIQIEEAHEDGETGRFRGHDVQRPLEMGVLPLQKRGKNNSEVQLGFNDEETKLHATRCYYCHYKYEIDQSKCIKCEWCVQVSPRNCIKNIASFKADSNGIIEDYTLAKDEKDLSFIWIDSKECIRCGKCLRVCPTGAISMNKTTHTLIKNGSNT